MARVRVRQHVNPLSHKYRTAIVPPSWSDIYSDISRPIHLDIGCARGRFLLQMAPLFPNINFLGVEIREALVIEANQQVRESGLDNVAFIYGNINSEPQEFLRTLPAPLTCVSIQFPDPWFKRRHWGRRVVQTDLINALAGFLKPGTRVFLQSDIQEITVEMEKKFGANLAFQKVETPVTESIFPVATEREIATIAKNEPVYRCLFEKIIS